MKRDTRADTNDPQVSKYSIPRADNNDPQIMHHYGKIMIPRAFPRYQSDVAALTVFGFDAVKLDGCGQQQVLHIKWPLQGKMTVK